MRARGQHRREVDVLVIGGGVVGAAASLAVSGGGRRVALVERSSLSVASGSSAGRSRIFAPAAYPDQSYLDMGLRALHRWREIENASGERLLWSTGALTRGAFAERQLPTLREAGVEAELVSAGDASRRFGVSFPDDDIPLLHQPDAGIIRADRARAVLLGMARAAGAELHEHEGARSIAEGGDSIEVETDRRRWRCSSAIVAAGPWTGELLADVGVELELSVSRQSVAYFELQDLDAPPVALIDYEGCEPFACWNPGHGLKAALHARGPEVAAHAAKPEIEEWAIDRVADWIRARYPGRATGPTRVEPCSYTNTPDERFIIERRGRIVYGSACNGHGFQFAPETGERLAQIATESTALSGVTS